MRVQLDPAFLTAPIAHRGLHVRDKRVVENSRAAVEAAASAGYGIEMDLQLSADGEAMVFHDDDLMRLTGQIGPVSACTAEELGQITLLDSDEGIPTLAEILTLVAGRVPLLVEVKDQSRIMGPVDGRLERRAARLLSAYSGTKALMSFNPHSVAHCRDAAPEIARGRVTCGFHGDYWATVPDLRRAELRSLNDLDALGCSFISHQQDELQDAEVARVAKSGMTILCWTVRSKDVEVNARRIAANVTFEHYEAGLTG
jgi:glycerophosphoryl diester phosphodiesterase